MRSAATILLLAATIFAAPPPAAPSPATPRWTPATYRGLVMASARRADAIRLLGPPDAATHTRTGDELLYNARGDHKGNLTIRLDPSGLILEIQESFPIAIPRTQIYKELGADALTAHYSQARCAANALYRDPNGAIELTLYPARGIVLWPDQFGYDFAAILYVSRPPGLSQPPACVSRH